MHLVNAVAPFVLNARLRPLIAAVPRPATSTSSTCRRWRASSTGAWKTDKHPHTNMAKAALNMMTRTSAADYVKDGIHMNSVDTGWVTDEDPVHHRRAQAARPRLPSARSTSSTAPRGSWIRSSTARQRPPPLGAVPQGLPPDPVVTRAQPRSLRTVNGPIGPLGPRPSRRRRAPYARQFAVHGRHS